MTNLRGAGDKEAVDGKLADDMNQISVRERYRYEYRMDHPRRGHFIIINNKKFEAQTGMSERSGTDVDAANLYELFTNLGFTVKSYHNLRAKEMMDKLMEAGSWNHDQYDCFGVAVLSHGEQGILFGVDTVIEIDRLIQPIKMCPSLAGKPKLLFFQACRGTNLDDGAEVKSYTDAQGIAARPIARIPIEADFLYAYSTTPGYFSWRNSTKGSWFVQALMKVFSEVNGKHMEIGQILTRVNYAVAYDFESNAAQPHMHKKKQVPSIVSMLTKELYFW